MNSAPPWTRILYVSSVSPPTQRPGGHSFEKTVVNPFCRSKEYGRKIADELSDRSVAQ